MLAAAPPESAGRWDDQGMATKRRIALFAAVGLAIAGCGGGDKDEFAGPRPAQHAERDAPAVIRAWADTLRRGDVRGAARFFALPSIVSNGTPTITLRTAADARAFNASLPCGARLIRTTSASRFTTAVFRLTERPGHGSCGSGTGLTARTTFVIKDGKIEEWRRVADNPPAAGPTV
jgi:hypothetical protein